jgi:hypothetical protein
MFDRIHALPPSSPPRPPSPLADIPEDPDDLYLEDEDDDKMEVAEVEAAAVAEAEQEEEEVEDNDDDDLPNPEEKAAEQRALLASFELAKEADNTARAHTQAEEEELRCMLELFVQRAPTEEASHRLFAEERQRLLEDAGEHRPFFAGIHRMQRAAAEQPNREGDDPRAGPSTAPKDGE